MTIYEAEKIVEKFENEVFHKDDDCFLYSEALKFLIEKTGNPGFMNNLGAFYYDQQEFDLALKYYNMAADAGDMWAISNLGYIWYYGRTGSRDYKKAFYYFDRARRMGDPVAAYKVADMYKNGYYVEKDYEKYKSIIEDLYLKVKDTQDFYDPLPEIFTRLAGIRVKEGSAPEALRLYERAEIFLARRIRQTAFFGDLSSMKWLIKDMYKLKDFTPENMNLYDLYHLLENPVKISFYFEGRPHEVESVAEDGGISVRFDDKWYRSTDDFFKKAEIEGARLTALYEELTDMKVL